MAINAYIYCIANYNRIYAKATHERHRSQPSRQKNIRAQLMVIKDIASFVLINSKKSLKN